MKIPAEKLYNAIFKRHSRRRYNGKRLPEDIVNYLSVVSEKLNNYVSGARVVMATHNPEEIFKGAVGSYGKIKGAPAYVAFIGNMEDPNVQEKCGYLGEFFILEATSLGLGTCWVGAFFRPEAVQSQIQLTDNEKVLAVLPFGFVDERYSIEEKIMSYFASSHKRKDLKELFSAFPEETLPEWIHSALEAARLAPSAVNRQPWRFAVEGGSIKISVDNNKDTYHISKRLDCGIAMAHIEVAAAKEGVNGEWEYLVSPDVARFQPRSGKK